MHQKSPSPAGQTAPITSEAPLLRDDLALGEYLADTFITPNGHVLRLSPDYCGCTTPSGFPIDHGKRCPQLSALAMDTPATSNSVASSDRAQACKNAATSCGEALAVPSPNKASISLAAVAKWPTAALRALSSISSRVMFAPRVVGKRHRKPGNADEA